ncbi:bacteriocin-like protein [Chryseobacterium sp. EZn1]|uniref:bacteriocin-like protein n=1 Tax=Chryseobacterium cupriresistens TaxID=3366770 RepID=UPI00398466C2
MKQLKKLTREDLKTVKGGEVWIAIIKCGFTATTTQDWTAEQANAWVDEIEKNYCKTPTYSGSDAQHLA